MNEVFSDFKDLPTVSIIIPAFNEAKHIGECLDSVLRLNYPKDKYDILVVDNGSTDDTLSIVREKGVRFIELPVGKVGAVRNAGAKNTESEIVAFIDSDCIAKENWLLSAVKKLKCANVGAVGGAYNLRDDASWVERGWVLGDRSGNYQVTSLVGGSFIVSRQLFERLSGFDEEINAGEDTKLSKSILMEKLEIWFLTDCSVIHLGYPSTLAGFAKRQYWHASSYLRSNTGLSDKTFIACIAFSLMLLSSIILLIDGNYAGALVAIILTFLVTNVFTAKRVFFGGYHKLSMKNLPAAIVLDYFYFLSRSAGLLIGASKDLLR